jgi:hypothetical protein
MNKYELENDEIVVFLNIIFLLDYSSIGMNNIL